MTKFMMVAFAALLLMASDAAVAAKKAKVPAAAAPVASALIKIPLVPNFGESIRGKCLKYEFGTSCYKADGKYEFKHGNEVETGQWTAVTGGPPVACVVFANGDGRCDLIDIANGGQITLYRSWDDTPRGSDFVIVVQGATN